MMKTPTTILVVDDNDAHRYFICRALEQAEYTAITARNGTSALEQASLRPDLILLDVQLPDLDGFEVCRRLKASDHTRKIPVVMFSSVAQDGNAVNNARQLGAASFLFFPVAPEHLLMVVEGQLRMSQSQNAT